MSGGSHRSPTELAAQGVRLTLSPAEASALLGVSRDFFDEHIGPELRVVRRGRLKLIPMRELERWLEREAVLAWEHR